MEIASGGLIFLGRGIALLYQREDKNCLPLPIILAGCLWKTCCMISPVLHTKPQLTGLSHVLRLVGAISGVIWSGLILLNKHNERKQAAVPSQSPPAIPSDEIWPPPPTSHL